MAQQPKRPENPVQRLIIPKPSDGDIIKAQMLLGTGETFDLKHILSCFDTKYWVMVENEELTPELEKDYIEKKIMLQHISICEEVRSSPAHRFELRGKIPFENPCDICNGLGIRMRFARKTQILKCMKCGGTGIRADKTECQTCTIEEKKTYVKAGLIRTFAIYDELKELTVCQSCNGRGFFKPKQVQNPVIERDSKLAEQLSRMVQKPSPKPANVGDAIDSIPPEPEEKQVMIQPEIKS